MRTLYLLVAAAVCCTTAFAQFPTPYCIETFPDGVLPITNVTFGAINNTTATPSGGPHKDFTTLSAALFSGTTYSITVAGATGGNHMDRYCVFFDWNKDNDFSDFGETFFIGNITNSTGTDGRTLTNTIAIPETSLEGYIRMRVVKKREDIPSPCNTTGAGQAQDYIVMISHPPPAVFYINSVATGLNNGRSWAHAYTKLDSALKNARLRDTIKVAAGTYTPAVTAFGSVVLKEGQVLLGGYPATGVPGDAARNVGIHQTIISGDVGTIGVLDDNSAHVIVAEGVTSKTIVDGFIIEKGYARYNSDLAQRLGGGIRLVRANPVIRNCVFRKHRADWQGAAVACINSSPSFLNCFFVENNEAYDATISNQDSSRPLFANCVFAGNTGTVLYNHTSYPSVVNCAFVNNRLSDYAQHEGFAVYAENNSVVSIANTIFYNNRTWHSTDSADVKLLSSTAPITNTITQVYLTQNANLQNAAPHFQDATNITGPDQLYFTPDDGLQLRNPCSAAINGGVNTALPGITQDLLGRPRVFGANVDLGPYEVQRPLLLMLSTVYVNKSAAGANDGSSWGNAFTDLQSALQACSDTIKVAAGTYHPSTNDPAISYWLENGRVLLGGYPATGNPADAARNPGVNPTILSGSLPAAGGVKTYVLLRGRYIDSTAEMNGFVLQDAAAGAGQTGAIFLTYQASPVFRNLVLKNNIGDPGGALVTHWQSNPTFINSVFENNTFSGNSGSPSGSAIANFSGSAPRFIKCIFKNNSTFVGSISPYYGGAMRNSNASPYLDSCTFQNNKSNNYGGAIANLNNSHAVIKNTTFSNNHAGSYGSDIFNSHSNPQVLNCTFSGNLLTRNGGVVANLDQSNPVFTNCEFRNGKADFNGGAVYNDFSNPIFSRCVFYNNSASASGGAVYSINHSKTELNNCLAVFNVSGRGSVLFNSKSDVAVTHCTFTNNKLYVNNFDNGGVIYSTDSNRTAIRNSIIYENHLMLSGTYAKDILDLGIAGASLPVTTITNSITKVYGINGVSGNIVGKHPRLADNLDPDGPDDIFFTTDDGTALSPCSPAINAGDYMYAIALEGDALDRPRQYGSNVDMGAYEFEGNRQAPGTYYVNAGASGNGSGGSWQNAYTNLQAGLCQPCADTVKVAAGTYKPALYNRDSSFFINQPLAVYGGYPATGNPDDAQRNPFGHATILSGNIGNTTDSLDNSRTVLDLYGIRDIILIDGLVIQDGYGAHGGTSLNAQGGAGLFTYDNETKIKNCRFLKNRATPVGGGLSVGTYGSCTVTRSVFEGNSATNAGGAVALLGDSLKVFDCVFEGNYAYGQGGAVSIDPYNNGMAPRTAIGNSIFYRNYTTGTGRYGYGGAVYVTTYRGAVFNCTFVENKTTLATIYSGGALYTGNSGPAVSNCIFKGNMLGTSAITAGADIDWDGNYNFVNNCLLQATRPWGQANKTADPAFIDAANPKGRDGNWLTNDDGLQLNFNSPAINYGDKAMTAGLSQDILGQARITGAAIDAGPYEFQNRVIAYAGADRVICLGSNTTIGIPGNPTHTYKWTSSPAGFTSDSAHPVARPASTTRYFLEVHNDTGIAKDTVVVTVRSAVKPLVTIATPKTVVCAGAAITFVASTDSLLISPTYQWQVNGANAGTGSSFTTTALHTNDRVQLMATGATACAASDTAISNSIEVTVTALPASAAGADKSICAGDKVAIGTASVAGCTYSWTPGIGLNSMTAAQPVANPSTSTHYILEVTNANGCRVLDTVAVSVVQTVAPSIKAEGALTFCEGKSVSFTSSVSSGNQWYRDGLPITGATTQSYAAMHSGVYTVRVLQNGCLSPEATGVLVTVKPLPATPAITATGNTLTSSAPAGNQWYLNGATIPNATARQYIVLASGSYMVQATQDGCSALSDTFQFVATAIVNPDAWNGEVTVFPNPVTEKLYIKNAGLRKLNVQLIDMAGLHVYGAQLNSSTGTVDVRHLAAGAYLLLLTDERRKETIRKMVVKN